MQQDFRRDVAKAATAETEGRQWRFSQLHNVVQYARLLLDVSHLSRRKNAIEAGGINGGR